MCVNTCTIQHGRMECFTRFDVCLCSTLACKSQYVFVGRIDRRPRGARRGGAITKWLTELLKRSGQERLLLSSALRKLT